MIEKPMDQIDMLIDQIFEEYKKFYKLSEQK